MSIQNTASGNTIHSMALGPDHIFWSHNDYAHRQPIHGAVSRGCRILEYDVIWASNRFGLLVGHNPLDLFKYDKLERYLPEMSADVILVLDYKGVACMFGMFRRALDRYSFPCKVIITHSDPLAMKAALGERYFIDGRFSNWEWSIDQPADRVPVISADFKTSFSWDKEADFEKIKSAATKALERGKYIRFWNVDATSRDEWVWRSQKLRGCGENILICVDHTWQMDALRVTRV
jgi:hypothetical protein